MRIGRGSRSTVKPWRARRSSGVLASLMAEYIGGVRCRKRHDLAQHMCQLVGVFDRVIEDEAKLRRVAQVQLLGELLANEATGATQPGEGALTLVLVADATEINLGVTQIRRNFDAD